MKNMPLFILSLFLIFGTTNYTLAQKNHGQKQHQNKQQNNKQKPQKQQYNKADQHKSPQQKTKSQNKTHTNKGENKSNNKNGYYHTQNVHKQVYVHHYSRNKVVVVKPRVVKTYTVLPVGYTTLYWGNRNYYFHNGWYYHWHKGIYTVVPPPFGIRIKFCQ